MAHSRRSHTRTRTRTRTRTHTHHEVEELGLLLIGSPLGQTGLAQVGVRDTGLDGLGGAAPLEALGHVKVLQTHQVLDGVQGRLPRLLHLGDSEGQGGSV